MGDVEPSANLDPRLTFKLNVLTRPVGAVRVVPYAHFGRGTVRGNVQPPQLGEQLRYCCLPFLGAKFVQDQLIKFPAAGFVLDITAFCYQEFVVVVEFHPLFMKVTFTILEPANHPFIDLLPSFERSAVWAPSDKKAQLVLSGVEAEPAAGFFIDEPG